VRYFSIRLRRASPKLSRRQNLGLLRPPSWESGFLGNENVPRGFPKYEVTNILGLEECTKVGCIGPKGHDAPNLGDWVHKGAQ
jgi:hypothetical protein